jgi:hypothetical protein
MRGPTQVDNLQWKIPDLDVALVGILSEISHLKIVFSSNPGTPTVYIGRLGCG